MPQIFIVDDSVSVRKALEITFKRHALTSHSAVSGEEALEALLNEPTSFDLLMVDVIMPGMSGLELCSTLRRQERFHSLPVILMSGNVDEEIRAQARDAGANAVLRKPFSQDELIPMVEGLLPGRAPAPDAQPAEVPALQAAVAAAPVPAPAAAPAPERPVGEAQRLIQHYHDSGRAEALALLDASHKLLGHQGRPLDPKLLSFASYFVNTARVIGHQFMAENLHTVTLRYQQRDVVLHVHADFTLVAVTRTERDAGKLLN
ncbi:CheY-like chemotaxis protein [Deinococcus metalli]|uniref:CheY-like chemotaxis protein n=1 Tax=Deinococcus metalli TaxID=1141878 RepID=A0A7W8NQF6_9DEIO|nr:response regulator [Deinococcus metalli]MBB5375813.1 CheY-like chemotaxis protein [Deinococcus metalli]GHF36838.1 transcriptional regulator [Deinococcus metalli]